jgi:hypothetical protein
MVMLLSSATATTQDFIDLYGQEEAIEITNLCDPLINTINLVKLQAGLDNARSLINSRYIIASDCGRALIKTSSKQLVLWVARYILDTTKARPFVDEDYDRAMDMLDYACNKCGDRCPLSRLEIEQILGENLSNRSRVRSFSGACNRRLVRQVTSPKVDYFSRFWEDYTP